jgi:hypothetical protein
MTVSREATPANITSFLYFSHSIVDTTNPNQVRHATPTGEKSHEEDEGSKEEVWTTSPSPAPDNQPKSEREWFSPAY